MNFKWPHVAYRRAVDMFLLNVLRASAILFSSLGEAGSLVA